MQHLVAAQRTRVWTLIEQGAIIYVCGDGGKMEPDVKAALVAIYRERIGADADAGLRWIEDLGAGIATCWMCGLAGKFSPQRRPRERGDPYAVPFRIYNAASGHGRP